MISWTASYQFFVAVLTSIGGGATVVWLMSGYLGKIWAGRLAEDYKNRYSRELEELKQSFNREIEAIRASHDKMSRSLQAELDRNIYVTKAHFDVELGALTTLWQRVNSLHICMNSLRPIYALMPAEESPEDQTKRLTVELSQNMKTAFEAYNAALSSVEDLRPFYPKDVSEVAGKGLKVAMFELNMIRRDTDRFSTQWYIDGSKNQEEFAVQVSNLEVSIRDRLERLSIRD